MFETAQLQTLNIKHQTFHYCKTGKQVVYFCIN